MLEATARVAVDVPEPGTAIDAGLKLTVTPVGAPDAVRAMADSKPPLTAVVTVDVPLLPTTTLTAVGEAAIVKAGLVGASALIRAVPCGLPQPVTRSYPVPAEKLPDVPLLISWKSAAYAADSAPPETFARRSSG